MPSRFPGAALGALLLSTSLVGQCPQSWNANGLRLGAPLLPFASPVADPIEIADSNGALPGGEVLLVGGSFSTVNGIPASNIAELDLDTNTWRALGAGLPTMTVGSIEYVSPTEIYAGGSDLGGPLFPVNARVDRFDGTSWTTIGTFTGSPFFRNVAFDIEKLPNGDVVVAGGFSSVNGVPAFNIARFDGTNWSGLGAGLPGGEQRVLLQLPNGNLLSGAQIPFGPGGTGAAIWNGTSWTPTFAGTNGLSVSVGSIAPLGNGEFLAGGGFFFPALGPDLQLIARWNGSDWEPVGGGIARPSGSDFGVLAVEVLQDGSFLAGGIFTDAGGVTVNNVARFDGTSWSGVGGGLGSGPSTPDQVLRFAQTGDGGIFAAVARGTPGAGVESLARLVSPCLAASAPVGAAGVSPTGPVTLQRAQAPYLGGAFVVEGQGFNAGDSVTAVYGLPLTPLPLSVILPQGLPGNALLVDLIVSAPASVSGGTAVSTAGVPALPSLIGGQVTVQLLAIRPGGPGGFALFGSNAVRGTIGSF